MLAQICLMFFLYYQLGGMATRKNNLSKHNFTTADHLHQNVKATKYKLKEEAGVHATMRDLEEDSLLLKQHRQ